MKITDIKTGDEYITFNGERYIIKDIYGEGQDTRCLALFPGTDNWQIIYPHKVNSKMIKDSSKSLLYGVGYSKGTKDNPSCKSGDNYEAYETWANMIRRCYYKGEGVNTYKLAQVCEEWHNFMNFKDWYKAHVPEEHPSGFAIDKDLFGHGKKIYCPEYCCMLPQEINSCIRAVKDIGNPSLTETSAKSVYMLSKLVDKYHEFLDERTADALKRFVTVYADNYKKVTKVSLNYHYKNLELAKTDLHKVKLTALVEYCGRLMKFENAQEMKKFIREIEVDELFLHKSKLV